MIQAVVTRLVRPFVHTVVGPVGPLATEAVRRASAASAGPARPSATEVATAGHTHDMVLHVSKDNIMYQKKNIFR